MTRSSRQVRRSLRRHAGLVTDRLLATRPRYRRQDGVDWGRDVHVGPDVRLEGSNTVKAGASLAGDVRIGHASTIGAASTLQGPLVIGRYCELGPAVRMYGTNHPMGYITTYAHSQLATGLRSHFVERPITVGHDVWFGASSIVVAGVTVATGAVIGAGAVVTHDIPEFGIAVGNPARVVGTRLAPPIAQIVLASRWWERSVDELKAREGLFGVDLTGMPIRELRELFVAHGFDV